MCEPQRRRGRREEESGSQIPDLKLPSLCSRRLCGSFHLRSNCTNFRYEEIRGYTQLEALDALQRGDADELRVVVIGIALHHHDPVFAEQFCFQLATHDNDVVRGNAVLGFGHLARRFGELSIDGVKRLVEASLADPSEYVRGHAWAAADDVTHFLGWTVNGFD
jgi:hypothetical protein